MDGTPAGPPAPLPLRLAAALVDLAILWALGVLAGFTVLRLAAGHATPAAVLVLAGLAMLLGWGAYFVWTEGRWGCSLGKLALGVRVVGRDGRPIGWRRALVRFAARLAGAATLGLAWLPALGSPAGQAWHDRVAGSVVCVHRPWQDSGGPGGR